MYKMSNELYKEKMAKCDKEEGKLKNLGCYVPNNTWSKDESLSSAEKISLIYKEHYAIVKDSMPELAKDLATVYKSHEKMLQEKNKRYGDIALHSLGIFFKSKEISSIQVRLDDKLSRVKNSTILQKNDISDILGYLILLCAEKGWFSFDLQNTHKETLTYDTPDIFTKQGKNSFNCMAIDTKLYEIKMYEDLNVQDVCTLIKYLMLLCVENEWFNFDDQID